MFDAFRSTRTCSTYSRPIRHAHTHMHTRTHTSKQSLFFFCCVRFCAGFRPAGITVTFLDLKEITISTVAKVGIKKPPPKRCKRMVHLPDLLLQSCLRGGTSSAGPPATCTSSPGTSRESWSCGNLRCTSPAPLPPSASPSPAVSCSWCRGSWPWACAAGRSSAGARTAGAWPRRPSSAAGPGSGRGCGGATGGRPAHGWRCPAGTRPPTGSRSWRWRGRWRRCRSRRRPCGFCSSSHTEGRTSATDHLKGDKTKDGGEGSHGLSGDLPTRLFWLLRKKRDMDPKRGRNEKRGKKSQLEVETEKNRLMPPNKSKAIRDYWSPLSLIIKSAAHIVQTPPHGSVQTGGITGSCYDIKSIYLWICEFMIRSYE